MSLNIPFSQACERNKDAILDIIGARLQRANSVLEIGTGTAQHALHFAASMPHLSWQTSDQQEYLPGIEAQLENAGVGNILAPLALDVTQSPWLSPPQTFDVIFTANTLHIMNEQAVEAFFNGLSEVVHAGSSLIVYGPFRYNGGYTSHSNEAFDQSLRARGVGSAIRDFFRIDELASAAGFQLQRDVAMPANNQCLIWQKIFT